MINQVFNEDCLEGMKRIPDKSIDMILCDLPYGTTRNKWDSVIDLADLWEEYKRIIKTNGAIVLTAQTPFDKVLGTSNLQWLKYEWIWKKNRSTGFLNAHKSPLKSHENILVFYQKPPCYNPIMTTGHPPLKGTFSNNRSGQSNYGKFKDFVSERSFGGQTDRFPQSVIEFNVIANNNDHPTQKPVALFEYLIKTYTNEGETVLDNCMGSGTTAIACINTNRNYIGFEKEEKYYNIIRERILKHTKQLKLIA